MDDFDEDTLEDIVSFPQESVIGPIAEMRRKKQIQENTMKISRENYENSTDMQVEAWFTKFDDVIIDDSANPYKDPLTKKELAFKIISKFNIDNLNSGIDKFNNGIEQFSKVIAAQPKKNHAKIGLSDKEARELFGPRKIKGNSISFWDEDKKTRKKRNKKKKHAEKHMPFYGSKKVKFF